MIKAEIVVDFPKWKTKIKNPSLYFKKKIKKLTFCLFPLKVILTKIIKEI